MNFLWDMVLKARKQGRKEEELFLGQAEEYSPFFEQSFACINETCIHSGVLEANLLYRFADIFQDLLNTESCGIEESEYEEFRRYLIDIMLHGKRMVKKMTILIHKSIMLKLNVQEKSGKNMKKC